MNSTMIPPDYGHQLSETVHRLTRDVHEAVEDGGWAAAESGRLHAWVHAEVVPWARGATLGLATPHCAAINNYLNDLTRLDAQMLGTAGITAADIASQLKLAVDRLVERVRIGHAHSASQFPLQRDNAN